MKWIDSNDFRRWADRRDCQDTLPLLIRRLIRATSKSIQNIKFPAGDSVLIGGWDGILQVAEETEYLPLGISLWEFGADKKIKSKADREYNKRTSNPLGFNPSESTFVFVTPRLWTKSAEWIREKKQDGIWKNILVINSEVLEEWIEIAPTVGAWLAKKHLSKYPDNGIQATDDFWEEWSIGPKFQLNPEILQGGRAKEVQKVIKLSKGPSVVPIQAMSREEALAFIISCYKDKPIEEDFFSRSLIVDSIDAFREISIRRSPLILIPRFEDSGVINRAIQHGHTVIVPLGVDSSDNWNNKIVLSKIERVPFIEALVKVGISTELAEKHSRESARNITVLRRQLEFTRAVPLWGKRENVSIIIPALLVGRWNDKSDDEKKIVSGIAGEKYEDYIKKLTLWTNVSDSPIVKIGNMWRLTSPLDAWINTSKNLSQHHFDLLRKAVKEIFSEADPAFELPPKDRFMANFYGKKRRFSGWIREGILQSLALISVFGEKLGLDLPMKAELWVDNLVAEILSNDDAHLWKSFQYHLPLIAEASPTAFLDTINRLVSSKTSLMVSLFEEAPGIIMPESYHTGLLRALEGLAWFPKYLSRSSLLLAKLATIDPGGVLSNRPINSLLEIFRPWNYQTLASFKERMRTLDLLTKQEKEIAWKLLINMLPSPNLDIAKLSNRTRWRMSDLEPQKTPAYKEVFDTHTALVELLTSKFEFSELRISQLVRISVNLNQVERDRIVACVGSAVSTISHKEHLVWHELRGILCHHRSYPEQDWALPESVLREYEDIYEKLTPLDEVDKVKWMFDEFSIDSSKGYPEDQYSVSDRDKEIQERRITNLKELYKHHGIQKVIDLSFIVKKPSVLGHTLSFFLENEEEIIQLCALLENEKEVQSLIFVQNFIYGKSNLIDFEWVTDLFHKLQQLDYSNPALAKLLVRLKQTEQLWKFIESSNQEVTAAYWRSIPPYFYSVTAESKIYGLRKLLKFNRFFSAIDICANASQGIPTELVVEILKKAVTEKAEENLSFDEHDITRLFKILDDRSDIEEEDFTLLEWMYLPILASFRSRRKPKRLHEKLANTPSFFIEVLSCVYKPQNSDDLDEKTDDRTTKEIQFRAEQSYRLLDTWKTVPGVRETGEIDKQFLNGWIDEVRQLAKEHSRAEVADIYIGKILAQYPEHPGEIWHPKEICDLIEKLDSESINDNFSAATFNKRGFSSRPAFSGGNVERNRAKYFYQLAAAHQDQFPSVTAIFERLAINYEQSAKRMDEEAERGKLEF